MRTPSPSQRRPSQLPIRRVRIGFWRLPVLKKWLALRQLRKIFPIPAMQRHTYIVAKSGSGKSELLKLLLLRLKQFSRFWLCRSPVDTTRTVFLIDPHGETAEECARQKLFARHQDNLVYITPRGKQFPCFNPFDLKGLNLSDQQLGILAQHFTRSLASMLGKGHHDLSLSMKTLLFPMFHVLLALSAENPKKPMTFFDLVRFLDDERNHDLVEFGTNEHKNEGQNRFFQSVFNDPQFTSTKFSLKTKLTSLLNDPIFVKLLARSHSTWNLPTLFGSGKTIIVNASKSLLGAEVTEVYGRTITAMLQGCAFLFREEKRCPTYIILDEAANFVSDDLQTILAELRKFGLHLILVNQVIRQGGASKELTESIMGNTGLKIIGNAGASTRRVLATECEISSEQLEGLRVGEFVVKADGRDAVRIRLPHFWLGNRSTVRREGRVPSEKEANLLHTEIEADRVSPKKARFRPRFGNPRPDWK